jgi:hypothetical protein
VIQSTLWTVYLEIFAHWNPLNGATANNLTRVFRQPCPTKHDPTKTKKMPRQIPKCLLAAAKTIPDHLVVVNAWLSQDSSSRPCNDGHKTSSSFTCVCLASPMKLTLKQLCSLLCMIKNEFGMMLGRN